MRILFKNLLIILCVFFMLGSTSAAEIVNRVVAVVNGEIITLYELNERLKPLLKDFKGEELGPEEKKQILLLKKKLLNVLIDNKLINQEAERLGVEVSETEVKNHIERIKEENDLTQEDLVRSLVVRGMTFEEYKEKVRQDILKHRLLGVMVQRKVVVTDEEIEAYYKKHSDVYIKAREVDVNLIVLPPDVDAGDLRDRIISDKLTFAEAAKKYSIGPGAEQGGDLGKLNWSDLAEDWRDVLSTMEEGEISRPFSFQDKQILLQLESLKAVDAVALEDVRDDIYEKLFRPKLEERFEEYMNALREKAVVENML